MVYIAPGHNPDKQKRLSAFSLQEWSAWSSPAMRLCSLLSSPGNCGDLPGYRDWLLLGWWENSFTACAGCGGRGGMFKATILGIGHPCVCLSVWSVLALSLHLDWVFIRILRRCTVNMAFYIYWGYTRVMLKWVNITLMQHRSLMPPYLQDLLIQRNLYSISKESYCL